MFFREDDAGAGSLGGGGNTAALEAAASFVAGDVRDAHFFGPGLIAHLHQGLNHLGIAIGSLLGDAIPGYVGFDDYNVLAGDEGLHPTQLTDGGLGDGTWGRAAHQDDLREASRHGDGNIASGWSQRGPRLPWFAIVQEESEGTGRCHRQPGLSRAEEEFSA